MANKKYIGKIEPSLLDEWKKDEEIQGIIKKSRVDTSDFLEEYCDPNPKYKAGEFNDILNPYLDREYVKAVLRKMPYKDFLNTKYWKTIREEKLKRVDFCQLCGDKERTIHIHHTDYSIRGEEYFHMNKLTCLCDRCHKLYHQSIEKGTIEYYLDLDNNEELNAA